MIADPANPDQAFGTYHVSALKDYQEPETKRNTGFVALIRKRGRPKKELPFGSEPRRQRNQRGKGKNDYNDDPRNEIADFVQSILGFQKCDEDIETWMAMDGDDSVDFKF
ncbi:hypothetical protein TNCV_3683271 [Trichonephila clavipes]|nr:hypothetical protein TNCV_3683271 [Trichonephila clavipes]